MKNYKFSLDFGAKDLKDGERQGYDFASGIACYLANFTVAFLIIYFIYGFSRNLFNFGIDDSDKDGFNRSGLTIHKDYKTGIEYLSDGKGGLIKRN